MKPIMKKISDMIIYRQRILAKIVIVYFIIFITGLIIVALNAFFSFNPFSIFENINPLAERIIKIILILFFPMGFLPAIFIMFILNSNSHNKNLDANIKTFAEILKTEVVNLFGSTRIEGFYRNRKIIFYAELDNAIKEYAPEIIYIQLNIKTLPNSRSLSDKLIYLVNGVRLISGSLCFCSTWLLSNKIYSKEKMIERIERLIQKLEVIEQKLSR